MTGQAQTLDQSAKTFHNASFRDAVFDGKTTFHKSVFTGTTDFSGAVFKGGITDFTEAQFEGDVNFQNATFGDPAKFDNAAFKGAASFAGTKFAHDAHFAGVQFAAADFSGVEFHAWGLFNSSTFASTLTCAGTQFRGAANFTDCQFAKDVDFGGARFIAFADFQRSQFRGPIRFAGASVECKTLFRDTVFAAEALFSNGRFTHPVNFASAQFKAAAAFDGVIFNQFVDFSKAHLFDSFTMSSTSPEMRFENVVIDHPEKIRFANVSFEKITLMGTPIRGIRIENPTWPKRGWKKRAVVYDEIQKEKPDPNKLADLYRDIRANVGSAGGDLFFSEMEVRRKQGFLRRYLSPYTLFWLTCGYGRRPLRALVFAGIAALIYFT